MKKLLIIILVVLAIAVGSYLLSNKAVAPTPSPTSSVVSDTNVKTYTSENLGIQFQYVSQPEADLSVAVKEVGNKVYVYNDNTPAEKGQFAEVFQKDSQESFEASIRRQILANYPSPDCKITVTPSNIIGGYQVAEISYPKPADSSDQWFVNQEKCNKDYDQTNGLRYFIYNPQSPNKFIFLSIGQYPIFGHDRIPWQDTLIIK